MRDSSLNLSSNMDINKSYKKLFGNIGVFALANFSTKILSFLILPLYTYYLTPAEYGTIDLVNITIQLLFPILSLSIVDALLRFGISVTNNKKTCFSISLKVILIGLIPMIFVCFLAYFILDDYKIIYYFILIYFLQALNSLFGTFCKTIDKTKEMAIIATVTSVSILILNVYFIAIAKMGINGYWLATIIGNLIGVMVYILGCKVYRYWEWKFGKEDYDLLKDMLKYSIPLIPNALFWWINSSLDRWSLTLMTSMTVVGLYSCANKIPTIISTVNSIFNQAWNLSLFQNNDTEEGRIFFERTYYYFNKLVFLCTLGIMLLAKVIALFMFSKDFFEAWYLVPILTFGVYINSLNSFLGSMFTATRQTSHIFTTTVIGSVVNLALNFIFVKYWGGMGAAISTLLSYLSVWYMRSLKIKKNFGIDINIKSFNKDLIFSILVILMVMSNRLWILTSIIVVLYLLKLFNELLKNKNYKKNTTHNH